MQKGMTQPQAFGLVLRRGQLVRPSIPEVMSRCARFQDYLSGWSQRGELFLLYFVPARGPHSTFETSRPDYLARRLSEVGLWCAARESRFVLVDENHPLLAGEVGEVGGGESLGQMPLPALVVPTPVREIETSAKEIHGRHLVDVLAVLDAVASTVPSLITNWMGVRLKFMGEPPAQGGAPSPELKGFVRGLLAAAPWWAALLHPDHYRQLVLCLDHRILGVPADHLSDALNSPGARSMLGMAMLEAIHMLDGTDIEQGWERDELRSRLGLALANFQAGAIT